MKKATKAVKTVKTQKAPVAPVVEKWILTKAVHFGFMKQTFKMGDVLSINRETNQVTLPSGRVEQDSRDLDICISSGIAVPFSQQTVDNISREIKTEKERIAKRFPKVEAPKMKVTQSDNDLMEREIDISHTNVKKAAEEAPKDGKMKVIRDRQTDDIRGMSIVRSNAADEADTQKSIPIPGAKKSENVVVVPRNVVKTAKTVDEKKKSAAEARIAARKAEVEAKRKASKAAGIIEVDSDQDILDNAGE